MGKPSTAFTMFKIGLFLATFQPSNVLVDTEGRLRLSEYGFPRVASNHIQLMNTKAISGQIVET